MDECEFKKFCDSIGYTYVCQKDRKEIAYCPVRITLNSPQFKKQSEEKIRKAIDDFREELVAQIKEDCKISVFGGSSVEYVRVGYLLNIILNHGKEE